MVGVVTHLNDSKLNPLLKTTLVGSMMYGLMAGRLR